MDLKDVPYEDLAEEARRRSDHFTAVLGLGIAGAIDSSLAGRVAEAFEAMAARSDEFPIPPGYGVFGRKIIEGQRMISEGMAGMYRNAECQIELAIAQAAEGEEWKKRR